MNAAPSNFQPEYLPDDGPETPWPLGDWHPEAEHWTDVFPRPTWRNPIRKFRSWRGRRRLRR